MENASRALLIAASVLIGIMILTLAVYLIMNFGGTSAQIEKQAKQNQINQFNSQFTVFDQRTNLTIYDVVTMANLATENNVKKELIANNQNINNPNTLYITVYLKGKRIEKGSGETDLQSYATNILQDINQIQPNTELKKYTAKVAISQITGLVYKIEIIET